MREEEPGRGDPLRPLDWRQRGPFWADAASDGLGWVDLEAARYSAEPAFETHPPALTHHWLILVTRPPEKLDLRYEGVKRHIPPAAGSILLVPAGSLARVRFSGPNNSFHVYLEPGLPCRGRPTLRAAGCTG